MKDGSGRRRKAAATLTVVWSSTIALHLIPGGTWVVFGITAMVGIHVLRVLLARPRSLPEPLSLSDGTDVSTWPYVSILVAAKNEETVIQRLVENLCSLDYPSDRYDVWMIDDSSTDETPNILKALAKDYENLHIICRPPGAGGGKSGALNQVWTLTQGDVIAVFDADAQVPNDLLCRVVPLFDRSAIGAVQVRKAIANSATNFWTKGQTAEMLLDAYIQQQRIAIGGIGELRGNGQFVRRSALVDCEGWNEETITDDLDLTLKLHINDWDIDLLAYPAVREEGVTTAIGLWHQRNRWAEGGYQRYLDYWRPLVQNRLGPGKSLDLLVFCMTQYIIPTAAVPDLLLATLRGRLPLLYPMTMMTVFISFIGMVVGLNRVRRQKPLASAQARFHRLPFGSIWRQLGQQMGAIAQAIRGTLYMMHWFVVMVSMTLRVSIRPKRLKWVKTVHHGADFNSPLPETREPEPSAEA
ncbi:MAG: glycosyltransferase family 2 protein [Leptolyngbyaceae bacterium]|nr:glycosyltransferase family 2 protein [Leptolyngbyaceae bacterium]